MAEQAKVATVCVSTGRDLTALVKPPRSLFVNAPMGNNFGPPDDAVQQLSILRTALALAHEANEGGVLIDFPFAWPEAFEFFTGRVGQRA